VIGVHVDAYNRAGIVDSFCDRYNRARHVDRLEVAIAAPQEAVVNVAGGQISSHHRTTVVDPKGNCRKVTRKVQIQCGEGAVAPDEATSFVCPVLSNHLALRVDETALRMDRTWRVERGENALVIEKGVRRGPPSTTL
jgi:hypothetical protein